MCIAKKYTYGGLHICRAVSFARIDCDGLLELQIRLLSDIQPHINLHPLHCLLRLISILFEEGASLNRLCHVLKMFINQL